MMAVTLAGASSVSAAPTGASTRLLSSQLPPGTTLARASVAQTAKAFGQAVGQRPDLAVDLTKVAVLARTPKQNQGQLSCEDLYKIVNAGVNAANNKSSEIVQSALSLHPECADTLNTLLDNPATVTNNGPDGFNTPGDLYGGFGVGFGPGFPGSPGFTGSPPSGAIALPPVQPVVTNVTNS